LPGYHLDKVRSSAACVAVILFAIRVLGALFRVTSGPVAALLTDMVRQIRCSSLSIRCHIGTGYSAASCRSSGGTSWRAPATPLRVCGTRWPWSRWRWCRSRSLFH